MVGNGLKDFTLFRSTYRKNVTNVLIALTHFQSNGFTDLLIGARASLGEQRLISLLCICTKVPDFEHFDATNLIKVWASVRVRRPIQSERKSYKARSERERPQTLIDTNDSE